MVSLSGIEVDGPQPVWRLVVALIWTVIKLVWVIFIGAIPFVVIAGLIRLYAFLQNSDASLEYLVTVTLAGAIVSVAFVLLSIECGREATKLIQSLKQQGSDIRRGHAHQVLNRAHQQAARQAKLHAPRMQQPSP